MVRLRNGQNPSPRRRPGPSCNYLSTESLRLDSGFRRNDDFRHSYRMPARSFLFLACLAIGSITHALEISTATGNSITYDGKTGITVIEGDAVIVTATGTLKADRIEFDTRTRQGHATGHVVIENSSGTLTAEEANYNAESSTGLVRGVEVLSPPWRIT